MNNEINLGRRRFLLGFTMAFGALGAGFVSIPFIGSWLPSSQTKALGAPVDVDVSVLEPGQKVTIAWRGQPIFLIQRPESILNKLSSFGEKLRDPNSEEKQQPDYANNLHRSIRSDILVLLGVCTHLGCVPLYRPKLGEVEEGWPGGFFCPCHGSKFDLAGRVFKGVPAPKNLLVPPYKFLNDKVVRIGEE